MGTRSGASFGVPFFQPTATSILRRSMATDLGLGLGNEQRDFAWTSSLIDGNERQITRVGMAANTRDEILRFHPHSDFHGRAADVVHARLQDDQLAQVNGLAKVHTVDRRGDTCRARVADRGHRGGLVDKRHDHAAEHVTQIVRILRKHERRRFVLRLPHGAAEAVASGGQGGEIPVERWPGAVA